MPCPVSTTLFILDGINYLEFDGDYPTKYSVEYNYANGAHTKSTIELTSFSLIRIPV